MYIFLDSSQAHCGILKGGHGTYRKKKNWQAFNCHIMERITTAMDYSVYIPQSHQSLAQSPPSFLSLKRIFSLNAVRMCSFPNPLSCRYDCTGRILQRSFFSSRNNAWALALFFLG